MISIIFSCFNEEHNSFFRQSLDQFRTLQTEFKLEVICVDGGSTDKTKSLIENHGFKFYEGDKKSRGSRYNLGLKHAAYGHILFHHPRSVLHLDGLRHLIENLNTLEWGAFTHKFDVDHLLLKFTSWYSNHIRGDMKNIFYLDHCLFVKKELICQIGGFPEVEIFEDTEVCIKLKSLTHGKRLRYVSTTSAIRFITNGMIAQSLLNLKMKINYIMNADRIKMNRKYEKNISLNTNETE